MQIGGHSNSLLYTSKLASQAMEPSTGPTGAPSPSPSGYTPPAPKPVPTTFSGKLRARLPSRGWMIFWATVGTLGGLVTRDHYLTVAAKKRVSDKVDVLAKQSCGVQDMPRKVTVYLTAPPGDGIHKTRHYFKQFVKVYSRSNNTVPDQHWEKNKKYIYMLAPYSRNGF